MIINLKGSVYLSLFLSLIVILSGCNNKVEETNKTTTPTVTPKKVQVVELAKKKHELPVDLFYRGKLNDEEIVVDTNDDRNVYSYNYKTKDKKILIENLNNNYTHKVRTNSDWIVSIQQQVEVIISSDKPYKWEIVAKNRKTGEKFVVDKSSFISKDFKVLDLVDFSPTELELDGDYIVYTKTMPNGEKVSSEINIFDLKKREKVVVSKTDNVIEEYIVNCDINDGRVVWNKYKQLNNSNTKRMTTYLYSDIYIYDIISKKIESLSENKFLDNPHLYKDKLVAVNVPESNPIKSPCGSEVVLIDIKTKDIKTIVNDKSVCYKKPVEQEYRTILNINSRYISWYDNSGRDGVSIFDYIDNKFIRLYEKEAGDSTVAVISMFDNWVFFHVTRGENEAKSFFVDMNEDA